MRSQDGGHLVHGRLLLLRSSSLSESPRASPLGPLEKSASGNRWVLVAPHESNSCESSTPQGPAQRQIPSDAATGATFRAATGTAPHGLLPPTDAPAVASAAPGSSQTQSGSTPAPGADPEPGSATGGLGGFVNRLRDGFGARRLTGSKRDGAVSAGTQVHIAANGEAVEMVTFLEAVSDEDGLDPSAAYQMVALRRPTLAQSGIEPSEAQFLLDQANAMLPQPQSQPLMQDSALTALADGIVLW